MSDMKKIFTTFPIRLALVNADPMITADATTLAGQFSPLAAAVNAASRERIGTALGAIQLPVSVLGAGDPIALVAAVADFLAAADQLDIDYGADANLPIEDADDAVDEALRCASELEAWLDRLDLPAYHPVLAAVVLGTGLWAMRHGLTIYRPEPIVNALANRANDAGSKPETAAAFAMMQGFISHLAPTLAADLERSNPERAWRLLNLNFAITAIRTGDADLMRYAFTVFNSHLPDERAGFYEEAHTIAIQPGFPPEPRALIEAEFSKWSRRH